MTVQNNHLLQNYKLKVNSIKESAKKLNLSDKEINDLFKKCFDRLEKENLSTNKRLFFSFISILKCLFLVIIFLILLLVFLNYHTPSLSLVLRNVQKFIYPGFKILRLLALPLIKTFPRLSELYDETCLIENPYFRVQNMECWPCENVHSVLNFSRSNNYTLEHTAIPYMLQTLNKPIELSDVQNLYKNYKDVFNVDAQRIKSNNPNFKNIEDILKIESSDTNTHITWRINRMTPARLIRTLFPKPEIIPRWSGQSTERFLMIDNGQTFPYLLPNPECSFVLLTQGKGERTIVLKPSQECAYHCRSVFITLKATYTLVYNWWYWRPISLPVEKGNISISYLSSFC